MCQLKWLHNQLSTYTKGQQVDTAIDIIIRKATQEIDSLNETPNTAAGFYIV